MLLSQKKKRHEGNSGNPYVRAVLHFRFGALRALGISLCSCAFLASSAFAQTAPTGTVHSVTLTWVAPSPVGGSGTAAGYNVYRSVGGAAFAKINTAVVAGLTTVDTAVTSGQQISYCATTVDSTGEESACSTAVSVTVPATPNPPTGLAVKAQ